jgi:hypothetical protein
MEGSFGIVDFGLCGVIGRRLGSRVGARATVTPGVAIVATPFDVYEEEQR